MPRRSILSASEREALLEFPTDESELIRLYTLNEQDLAIIQQHRGKHNRLGFAVQLCYLKYPGYAIPPNADPPAQLLAIISQQLRLETDCWRKYSEREETRREHLLEIRTYLSLIPFGLKHFRKAVHFTTDLALQTDKGLALATQLLHHLRTESVVLPPLAVIERICAEAVTRSNRRIYQILTASITDNHRRSLNSLLYLRENTKISTLVWLRQPPGMPNAKHLLEHMERLRVIEALHLPEGLEHQVHQNRLLKIAREGGQMTAQDIGKFEPLRRYATLIALLLDTKATLIDEIVDLHDRIMGTLMSKAKRKHSEQFQQSGKAINSKVRLFWKIGQALLEAKQNGVDPFSAIESIITWDEFTQNVTEAQQLAQPEAFDYLKHVGDGYTQVRRYAPILLNILQLKATPAAQDLQEALQTLKIMNEENTRKVPTDAPTSFVRKRWESLVFGETGIERRFYELCTLTELKNALRSGDIWVKGSRQFKDFQDYLLPAEKFQEQMQKTLPLAVNNHCERYVQERMVLLSEQLKTVNQLAQANALPDAVITDSGLKITPLINAVPDEAEILTRQAYALLPHVKITELLLEVDTWTGFTQYFTHLKSGEPAVDKNQLLTAVLADGINLGLSKMAESCPGSSYAKLAWLQAWHIRDETYSLALAELVNAQNQQAFAGWWGDGTTSSSDGQRFQSGSYGQASGQVNLKYGNAPGKLFYTHISDQYAPFHTQVINATVRDATYVLDGLLYHESDLRIEEHYTDTAGFTDHVFALMHLLGFRFAPRIRDLADRRLYIPVGETYPTLSPLIGGTLNLKHVQTHWDEILRLATSIRQGTVTASLILRKLGSYPRQNGLAVALRELGRIERTLFTLDWLQNVELGVWGVVEQ